MKENSSIWIDAGIDKIWQAITDEQQLSQWYAPGSTWKIPSLVAGEKIIFTLMPNGLTEKLPIILTIKNVIQNQEFSFFLDIEETLIAIVLEEAQKGTTVTINMSGYEASLANLKALVEGN
ncbi:SRPBCC family protein [Lysinibacillus pakistanensis]|uniref:Activator of Hsp90 ATPase homologue 1/2-like C-terminal domain-containing protein n=1 Tax=Lysinibacillus pakistanensis TaxID=759811 RepID=A0ABX6D9G3_9BACI|nr:hypothetical protein GDS87_10600 [Lysinibacillus pakistanensis]